MAANSRFCWQQITKKNLTYNVDKCKNPLSTSPSVIFLKWLPLRALYIHSKIKKWTILLRYVKNVKSDQNFKIRFWYETLYKLLMHFIMWVPILLVKQSFKFYTVKRLVCRSTLQNTFSQLFSFWVMTLKNRSPKSENLLYRPPLSWKMRERWKWLLLLLLNKLGIHLEIKRSHVYFPMSSWAKIGSFPLSKLQKPKNSKNTYNHSIVSLILYTSLSKELRSQLLRSNLK